jgi:hypothetical protein
MTEADLEHLRQATLSARKREEVEEAERRAAAQAAADRVQLEKSIALKAANHAKAVIDGALKAFNVEWQDTGVQLSLDIRPLERPQEDAVASLAIRILRPTGQFSTKRFLRLHSTLDQFLVVELVGNDASTPHRLHGGPATGLSASIAKSLFGDLLHANKI